MLATEHVRRGPRSRTCSSTQASTPPHTFRACKPADKDYRLSVRSRARVSRRRPHYPVVNVRVVDGLRIASATDVGRRRSENEDCHVVWGPEDPEELGRRGVLLVVADGMGGANAGEAASRIATEVVLETFREHPDKEPDEILRTGIETANSTIHDQAAEHAEQHGMGTTCTTLIVRGRDVWLGHVGDSRAYIVRSGSIVRLTRDHSLVSELVEQGYLSEEDAKHDPRRNVVTRSVGATDAVEVDAERVSETLRVGDALVMCSDGLHGQVTDSEIARAASENDPEAACQHLIDLANERGGPDNITVIVARARERDGDAAVPRPVHEKRATAGPARAGVSRAHAQAGAKPSEPLYRRMQAPLLVVAFVVSLTLVVGLGRQVLRTVGGSNATVLREADPVSSTPGPAPPFAAAPASDDPVPPGKSGPKGAVRAPGRAGADTAARRVRRPPAESRPVSVPAHSEGTGTLSIVTFPFQPCDFFIDGEAYSQAVGSIRIPDLPSGHHSVRVNGARGVTQFEFDLKPGGSLDQVATLPGSESVGEVELRLVGATSARILVDGATYPQMAPCRLQGLAAGKRRIRAIELNAAHRTVDTTVDVTAGSTSPLEIRFPE